jgi:hypothetical protein
MRLRFLLAVLATLLVLPPAALAQHCGAPERVEGFTVRQVSYGTVCPAELTRTSPQARDGSRADLWTFQGTEGDCVTIALAGAEFAPYVQLLQGSRNGAVVAQDSSVPPTTLAATGTYFVKATSSGPGEQLGRYTFTLSRC